MKFCIGLLILGLVVSCGGDNKNSRSVTVIKKAPNVPCGSGVGEGYNDSATQLAGIGVDVQDSRCAFVVDDQGVVECELFERVNIHNIPTSNLSDAKSLGYFPLNELETEYGLSLSNQECSWAN